MYRGDKTVKLIELMQILEGNVVVYIEGRRVFADVDYIASTYPNYIVESFKKEKENDKYYTIKTTLPSETEVEKCLSKLECKLFPVLKDQITALTVIEEKLRKYMEYNSYMVSHTTANNGINIHINLERRID